MNEARRLIEDRESLWSTTREIYKANHSGGQMITVREETADLLNFTPGMAEKTDVTLDPAIYPILDAQGFETGGKQVPARNQIKEKLRYAGYEKIRLEDRNLKVPERYGLAGFVRFCRMSAKSFGNSVCGFVRKV